MLFPPFCFDFLQRQKIMTKLNQSKKSEVVALFKVGGRFTRAALARRYHVKWDVINRIVNASILPVLRTRAVPHAVTKRRRMVAKLAKKTVVKNGRKYPVFCTATAIKEELNRRFAVSVSKATVLRDLHHVDFECLVRRRVPTRDPKVVEQRLRFCAMWLRRGTKNLVFSDEHTISVNDHTSRTMWVAPGHGPVPRERRRLTNVPRIMVWAAIGQGFKSELILFPQAMRNADDATVSFRLCSDSYIRRCLSPIVPLLNGRVFQQDGAKVHTAHRVGTYLRGKNINYIQNWPPYSPDLNCSELVWPLLNRRVAEYHPSTLEELGVAAKKAWASITQGEIDALCRHFHSKIRAVYANGGRCE